MEAKLIKMVVGPFLSQFFVLSGRTLLLRHCATLAALRVHAEPVSANFAENTLGVAPRAGGRLRPLFKSQQGLELLRPLQELYGP